MEKAKAMHRVKIELDFRTRRDFLALKNAVSKALSEARGHFGSYLPLQQLLDKIEKQAEEQAWQDLWRDPVP